MKPTKKYSLSMQGNGGEILTVGEVWIIRTTQPHADAIAKIPAVDHIGKAEYGYYINVSPLYDRDDITRAIRDAWPGAKRGPGVQQCGKDGAE